MKFAIFDERKMAFLVAKSFGAYWWVRGGCGRGGWRTGAVWEGNRKQWGVMHAMPCRCCSL